MPAPRLTVAVGAASASAPAQEVTDFGSGSVKLSLFAGPVVSFTMAGRSPAALLTSGLATDVWVYRGETLWQRGRVLPVAQEWTEDGDDQVSVTGVGYRQVVEARHIVSGPPTFTGVEQGTIIWNLIQHTQAQPGGDLGITQGDTDTGQPRDRTEYQVGDNIGKLLGDLAGVINGPWWGIDANKVLTARLFSAFPSRPDPIVHGTNARRIQRRPGARYANVAGVVGSREQTTVEWRATVDVATDPRGRWEVFDASHSSVVEQTRVADYADGLLAERGQPPHQWTVQLDPWWYFDGGSDYDVGEVVRIVVPPSAVDELGVPRADVLAQVTEVSIGFSGDGGFDVSVAAVEL